MVEYTDKEVLHLFREFTIKNATQWKLGSNHHHPIWAMMAEKLEDVEDIKSGPAWQFIQPENREPLQTLADRAVAAKDCPICKNKRVIWVGGQGGDYESCECNKLFGNTGEN